MYTGCRNVRGKGEESMRNINIIMLDSGKLPMIYDLSNYSSMVERFIEKCKSVEDALYMSIQNMPSFRVALFAVDGEYFIAEGQTVNLSKYRKSSRKPTIVNCTITEVHLKPVKNRETKRAISLYITRYTQSVTERLEFTDNRRNLLISCLKFSNMADVYEVADKTVHC